MLLTSSVNFALDLEFTIYLKKISLSTANNLKNVLEWISEKAEWRVAFYLGFGRQGYPGFIIVSKIGNRDSDRRGTGTELLIRAPVVRKNYGELIHKNVDAQENFHRWTFKVIGQSSCHWTGELSNDGGETWVLSSEFFLIRSSWNK